MVQTMKMLTTLGLVLLAQFGILWGQSISQTYTLGNIPTTFNTSPTPNTLAEQPGILTVTIPVGATITSVGVVYSMTSQNGMYMDEQRSYMRCTSPGGVAEAQVHSGFELNEGVWNYNRQGLTIANNVTGGGDIVFELHAFRVWGGTGTNTHYCFVNNNTWTVTVHYQLTGAPGTPSNPNPVNFESNVSIFTDLIWTNGVDTDNVQVLLGTTNPPTTEVYSGAAIEILNSDQYNGPLDLNTTYYWRVIASNATHTTPGPIWRFTTVVSLYSASATYTLGDIPSAFVPSPTPNSLSDQPGLLTVNIPGGSIITGVDLQYTGTATNNMYLSELAAYLRCTSPGGVAESQVYYGTGTMGTQHFSREALTIANNVVGGGDINFELHVFRVWGGTGTNTNWGYVNNNTWSLIVYFEPVGAGTLEGYVYEQGTTNPMQDVTIQVLGTSSITTTNAVGFFIFPIIQGGTYNVKASKFGYHDQIIEDVVIIENDTTDITFGLTQLANVTVSGQIVGSDDPDIGLEGAEIYLTGYDNYQTLSGMNGMFSIPGVYSNQTYSMLVVMTGYSNYVGEVIVGGTDLNLGLVIVNEIANPPFNLVATQNASDTAIDLIWNTPVPINYSFWDFEDGPGGWTSGAVYGANQWQLGAPGQAHINSAYSGSNAWMTRLAQYYDDLSNCWLMSPELDFTGWHEVHFSAFLNIWCEAGYDGMILEASTDGGASWFHVRANDTALQFYNNASTSGPIAPPKWSGRTIGVHGIWHERATEIPELVGASSVFLRFRFGSDYAGVDEGVAVDDVYVGTVPPDRNLFVVNSIDNTPNVRNNLMRNRIDDLRILESYNIYRFLNADSQNEDNWVLLGTAADTTYTDLTWAATPTGFYRYAVKALYTNDVLSNPAISNWVGKDMTANVTVNMTTDSGDSAAGAQVTLFYQDQDPDGNSPSYLQNAIGFDPSVATFINILRGTYDLEVTLPGYMVYNQTNINIQEATVLNVQLAEIPYPPANLHYTSGPGVVNLMWDPPAIPTRGSLSMSPSSDNIYSNEIKNEAAYLEKLYHEGVITKEEVSDHISAIINSRERTRNEFIRNERDSRALLGYNVYRNGIQINAELIIPPAYIDTNVQNNVQYTYYVTAVYSLAESIPSNSVNVVPGPQQLVIIGNDTTSTNYLPLDFFWRNSLSQTIYMQSEIDMIGLITEIQYFNTFVSNLPNMPVKIWIAETTLTNLTTGWLPASLMELVFNGNVDFPAGQNTISIELDTPFFYNGVDNLVILANRPMDTTYYDSMDHFFYTNTPEYPNRSRSINSDLTEFNPYYPPGYATLLSWVPNTGLNILPVGMGSLMGLVHDVNNQPIVGATVTVLDSPFQTQTDGQGYYFFPIVFEGEQTVVATQIGYYDSIAENVLIIEHQTVIHDFTMNPLPTVSVSGRIVGSDLPGQGLDNALITLGGYHHYQTTNNNEGFFYFEGVYALQVYDMTIQRTGYQTTTIQLNVGDQDLNLGDVVINELAFTAENVVATLAPNNTEVYISWLHPASTRQLALRQSTRSRTIRNQADEDRVLVGYIIYRLASGNEGSPQNWWEIGVVTVTETSYTDTGIVDMLNGDYLYAVRAVYTNNVLSEPAFSNIINYVEHIPNIANLQATVQNADVTLTWDWATRGRVNTSTRMHDQRDSGNYTNRAFLGFKITRNQIVIVEGLMENTYTDEGLASGDYNYTLIGQFTNGSTNMLFIDVTVVVGVDDQMYLQPFVTSLHGNYPNPFNPETKISFSIAQSSHVLLEVFNLSGQRIAALLNEELEAGSHSVVWNGKTSNNIPVGSGVYFYRIRSGSYSSTKKMILLK